jgi:hypothetical protein
MSDRLLKKVRAGVFASSRTVHYVVDYCRMRFDATGTDLG